MFRVKIVNPDYSVEMIVQRMKEAAAREPGAELSATSSSEILSEDDGSERLPVDTDLDIHPIALEPPFHPRSDDHYHADELLKYSDRRFLINAYRAILKRSPDEIGYNGFIEALRSGELNKIDVLGRLRFSEEGRKHNVHIDGLSGPVKIRKLYRIPIVGYFINLFVAIFRLPMTLRNHRQFESHALVQQEILANQINHVGNTLVTYAGRIGAVDELNIRLDKIASEQSATNEVVLDRVSDLTRYFEERVNDEASERQSEVAFLRNYYDEELSAARSRAQAVGAAIDAAQEAVRELSERVSTLQNKNQQLNAELTLQGHRLTRILDEALATELTGNQDQLQTKKAERPHLLDAFYASFDEQFRGDRNEIKQRFRVYLPFIANLPRSAKVLDIGCGRGEWLELLTENGWQPTGVDSNSVLVDQCRAKGLQVVQSDLVSYLNALSDESIDALSGFHVVEHLSVETLVQFLNEALRVLKPGGVVILETPNPRNVLVGSCNFYFDPTHRNPIPSEVLKFLVDSRGFSRTQILPLNPSDEKPVEGESEIVVRFNQYFYGPMDYGVVGWKPEPGELDEQPLH